MRNADTEKRSQYIYIYIYKFSRIDVNLKSETYCHGISAGTEKEWDFAWNRFILIYVNK